MSSRGNRTQGESADEQLLTSLFRGVSVRERAPEEHERELRVALYTEWSQITGRRVRARRNRWLAVAASVVAVIVGTILLSQPPVVPDLPPTVAHVQNLEGEVRVSNPDRIGAILAVAEGSQLREGHRLATTAGQLAVSLERGGSLRLATDTVLQLVSGNEVELVSGAVYFDSRHERAASDPFLVHTSAGAVRHLGTQYIARDNGQSVEISVREGAVELSGDGGRLSVSTGEMLQAAAGGQEIGRQSIDLYGDHWEWADRMAPAFEIDGNTLFDFLSWAARETGYRLQFDSADVERAARLTILHGRIDMEPFPMLSAVLSTTELRHDIGGGVLHIGRR